VKHESVVREIPNLEARRFELREMIHISPKLEDQGVQAAIRLANKVRDQVLPAGIDYAQLSGMFKIDFAKEMKKLEARETSPEEITALMTGLLRNVENQSGKFIFANLDALQGESKSLADAILSDRPEEKGLISRTDPIDGTSVTELDYFDGQNAVVLDPSKNHTVFYALGIEKGALPNDPAILALGLLQADFFANHGKESYDQLIISLRSSTFFEALTRFASSGISAEQAYDVMRGSQELEWIRQVAVRPLVQFLNNRIAAARLALQAEIAA
jgi:hypothetical protein